MKGLMVIVPIITLAILLELPLIRRATYKRLLKEKPTLRDAINENAPELSKMIKQIRGDTVLLKNNLILIFGKGRYQEKAKVAGSIIKSGIKAREIDLTVPGYALIKNGGSR